MKNILTFGQAFDPVANRLTIRTGLRAGYNTYNNQWDYLVDFVNSMEDEYDFYLGTQAACNGQEACLQSGHNGFQCTQNNFESIEVLRNNIPFGLKITRDNIKDYINC